ncbi:sporulation protein YjcZ [Virgibacillus profundi]|uniref:Sporulation protein YjcZ n=1 Tax=Virgibacillus profundi TaxID=2024555 RepID=A0A2A2II07_9BACI|nr:YjcZ family sporulation protein [Virgibacillus profundi]PAV30743.1 sporulation protein YjcZ [Virgibacillus profundi]PXY54927.1 YjcZ family sporulation protein [Virgibacillus profundi]
MSNYNDYQGGFDRKKDNNFALIVVLFILLIIVGVSFVKDSY